jgi:hypothetical protein
MLIPGIRCGLLTSAAVLAALTSNQGGAAAPLAATNGVQRPARTAPASASANTIRRPRGIYAVVVLQEKRGAARVDLNALAGNPAVSGLAIRVFWSELQPAKDRYDFSPLEAAFATADATHKTVQLIVVPGFGTPAWVLSEIPSCDDLLPALTDTGGRGKEARGGREGAARGGREGAARGGRAGAARGGRAGAARGGRAGAARGDRGGAATGGRGQAPNCGKASFIVSEGGAHGEKKELPLPWNAVYKKYWRAFLTELAARFGTRDAFVSIAVAGPTAESVEIILPRAGDQLERWAQLLQLFYRDSSYQRSDKAFVEEWDAAVTVFGEVFHNMTIVLTRGSGLLDFTRHQGDVAQGSIVSSFAAHAVGADTKATQTSGMKACRETVAGIKGVKELSASSPILGGAQFNTSFSQKPAAEGCKASCKAEAPVCQSVTPAEALSNVLSVYFDGTPDGALYGASRGAARMNYLQVYEKDILFANTQPAVQAILEQASRRLLMQAR